jgi:hypothetical protein
MLLMWGCKSVMFLFIDGSVNESSQIACTKCSTISDFNDDNDDDDYYC